jgi:bifunctional UDP-N-acetylglucosamine pyrophosphorylase / glucosamine-1-phosphate N-acetyltransferase
MEAPVSVLILAAGLGTRMKSKRAKVLHRAGGLSLAEHVVHTAARVTSPDRITVVVGHQADQVQELLQPLGVRFATQAEQKGTGHAVLIARDSLAEQNGLLVVLYGDCPLLSQPTLEKLIQHQVSSSAAATVITTELDDPSGYGRIVFDASGSIREIVEHKAATEQQRAIRFINSGIYCFRAELLWKHIGEIRPDNPAREFYLTDMVAILTRAGHRVDALNVADSAQLLGINTRAELAMVDRIFRERKVQELMLGGVTIEKPESVTIDACVSIDPDTVIEPFAQILGRSRLGEDCRIGACSIIRDSTLASEVEVAPFTSIADSRIESGAHIGPFARLRGGTHVGENARIGNFVELKNTQFAEGAKANHLAYIGDAEIGKATNIGAGTITCNYDGNKKHRTRVGEDAFVGSNSTLVAPVEIGDGSYIGAGSVITEKVPPDALALGRARQIVKEDWAAKRKKKK